MDMCEKLEFRFDVSLQVEFLKGQIQEEGQKLCVPSHVNERYMIQSSTGRCYSTFCSKFEEPDSLVLLL